MSIKIYDSSGGLLSGLTQWDVNRTICVGGLGIISGDVDKIRVHFANRISNIAAVVPPGSETIGGELRLTAMVPNFLLQNSEPISVFIYKRDDLIDDDSPSETIASARIGITPRPRPDDYVYEDNFYYYRWKGDKGDQGDMCMWFAETRDPTNADGEYEGDMWINTISYDVFRFNSVSWSNVCNIKGAPAIPERGSITLYYNSWVSETDRYTQSVSISGATANSQIDLCYGASVISQMIADGVPALFIENNNGTLKAVCAINPLSQTVQVQYTRLETQAVAS